MWSFENDEREIELILNNLSLIPIPLPREMGRLCRLYLVDCQLFMRCIAIDGYTQRNEWLNTVRKAVKRRAFNGLL